MEFLREHEREARPAGKFRARRTRSWRCPMPSRFSLLVAYVCDDVCLRLSGDLCTMDAAALDECFEAALRDEPRKIILDLSTLISSDDSGIEFIRTAPARAATHSIELVLDSPDSNLLALLTRGGETFSIRNSNGTRT